MGILRRMGAGVAAAIVALQGGGAVVPETTDAAAWLEAAGRKTILCAERQMADGTRVYAPQAGCKDKAFWLRDYVMMLEGGLVPKDRIVPCAKIFLGAVSPEGFGVDCVKFDGTPVYKPGYGTMGDNPVLDGSPYTVKLAYESWRATGEAYFLSEDVLRLLAKTLAAIPLEPEGCLAWIDPSRAWERCPFGFIDTVRLGGACLFPSLLTIEARRDFAEMLEAAGRQPEAREQRRQADAMAAAVETRFWDASVGLYRAATHRCREHDVWGSAYAVWLGVADREHAQRVAAYFRDNYDGLVQRGQIRQLPAGVYWEDAAIGRDTYQNGAYWGTAAGWFAWTLARVDRPKALALFDELVADYRARGANEWVLGERVECPDYLSSLALPLQGLRRVKGERLNP